MKITIYTDGSSRGNPGKGGWGCVLITEHQPLAVSLQPVATQKYEYGDEVIELGGREDYTTNNRMELMGAIKGLQACSLQPVAFSQNAPMKGEAFRGGELQAVEVLTDSEYVRKGMTEWISGWVKKGWKTSTKKDVLNKDLWEQLLMEEARLKSSGVHVTWKYVQAHVGIKGNERADEIATACADNASHLQLYRGSKSEYPYI